MADVELPQLGESVTEGIITQWLVEVGDTVEVDQPIVEISTDKVDTEIPSPVAGTVQELRADVDDEVEVGQVIAVIGEGDGAGGGGGDDGADEGDADEGGDEGDEAGVPDDGEGDGTAESAPEDADADEEPSADGSGDGADEARGDRDPARGAAAGADKATSGAADEAGEGTLTSPLVRKLLREAGLFVSDVKATGQGGRITREDAERAIESGGEGAAAESAASSGGAAAATPSRGDGQQGGGNVVQAPQVVPSASSPDRPSASPTQIDFDGQRDVTQDLTRVRKAIAKGMMESLQSTAQLTAAVEVDMTAVMNLRAAVKDEFKSRNGVSLSPLPFVCRAVTMAIPRHPAMNSTMDLDGGTATFHRYVNLGMAVDTERGLLVPNLKDAEDLTVTGLAKAIADLAKRTRDKKIQPDEITGATFTVTNTGSVGTLFDTPILNPPEVAILAACAIEKRPVVVSDAYGDSIAIRQMSYLCLSYDHRMLDGADAARFLQDVKWTLEHHDFRGEVGV